MGVRETIGSYMSLFFWEFAPAQISLFALADVADEHELATGRRREGVVDGHLAVIPGLIAVFFYSRYRIDERQHAATRAGLLKLRAGGLGDP